MDKYSMSLARFLEMRVQVRLGTYTTVFGNLVEVNSEFLRLENSRIVDEYEESDWGSKLTEGDPEMIAASSNGESLIRMNYVSSVTCMSDQLESPRSLPSSRSSDSTMDWLELATESASPDVFSRPADSDDAVSNVSGSPRTAAEAEAPYSSSWIDEICIELGVNLTPMSAPLPDGNLRQRIDTLRREIERETGIVLPPVRIRSSSQLEANAYRILVQECELGRFQLQPQMQLLLCDEGQPSAEFHVREPISGMAAKWVALDMPKSEPMGRLIDGPTILATHLKEIVLAEAWELLRFESVQQLLDRLRPFHPVLVSEWVPGQLSIRLIHFVLTHLLRERVSIRNLPLILEAISHVVGHGLSDEEILWHVRQRCGRSVCGPYISQENVLSAVTLSPDAEAVLAGANGEKQDLEQLDVLIEKLKKACHPRNKPALPILVASVEARERVWLRMNVNNQSFTVIGRNEVPRNIQVQAVEELELEWEPEA